MSGGRTCLHPPVINEERVNCSYTRSRVCCLCLSLRAMGSNSTSWSSSENMLSSISFAVRFRNLGFSLRSSPRMG